MHMHVSFDIGIDVHVRVHAAIALVCACPARALLHNNGATSCCDNKYTERKNEQRERERETESINNAEGIGDTEERAAQVASRGINTMLCVGNRGRVWR